MRWKTEHTVACALVIAVAIPVAIILAARHVTQEIQSSTYWLTHSRDVQADVQQARLDGYEAAAKMRAYAFLGDPATERAAQADWTNLNQTIATIRQLTRDNPTQAPRLDHLQQAAAAARGLLEPLAERRQAGDITGAQRLADSPAALTVATGVANAADAVWQEEQRLAELRRAQLTALSRRWQIGFYGGCLASLLLIALGFGFLTREVRVRRRTQEALDYSLGRVTRLTANVPAVVWIVDAWGRVEFVSDRVHEALGLTPAEASGTAGLWLTGWCEPETGGALAAALQLLFAGAAKTGGEISLDVHLRAGSGGWRWVHAQARRVRRPSGELVADGILHDITERTERAQRAIEQQGIEARSRELERVNRFRSEFLATISHELRTPLSAILGFSELMLFGASDSGLSGENKLYAEQIHLAGKDMLALTNDVLDLGKLEAGQMTVHPDVLPVSWPLAEAMELISPLTQAKRLQLLTAVDPGLEVWGDHVRVRQILLNLLSNAVKFTPEGGTIAATADHRGDMIWIAVADTGPGIPKDQQKTIFERYQQAGADHAMRAGTGLGLAIAKHLVERQGGTIWVESEPGKGARFIFSLPAPATGRRLSSEVHGVRASA